MFNWRYLRKEDYDTLVTWWKWFRFPAPTKEMLPDKGKGGIMVFKENTPVCAGFLYQTNSSICFMEYIVSNPEYRDKDRQEGIKETIRHLSKIGSLLGYEVMFTFVNNKNLIDSLEETGFIQGSNSYEFVKKI